MSPAMALTAVPLLVADYCNNITNYVLYRIMLSIKP